jgi:hypothetical protein
MAHIKDVEAVICPPKTGPKVMRLFEDAKIARKGALLHEKVPI